MRERGITPSQTVGPFFSFALTPAAGELAALAGSELLTEDAAGQPIRIEGRVLDGAGEPVADAMIEIWQADGAGRHAGTDAAGQANTRFRGFGRCGCDEQGRFGFTTVKPGIVPGPGGLPQAPHIVVGVFARGLLRRLVTRIYFADEPATAADPVLALVPPERRATLVTRCTAQAASPPVYAFDIHLQGPDETVFFEA